ncbi:hypothetical protein DEO72_LG3g1884 [Vigna unguiculata]|uniref:Uncharacterized protein n=1 Tax=Vigna unguiculata TaxID=3917 RepID=A0A4D6LFR5_VIGUN|nr:hypothetical protein DEO72_LG3g1884 [Vigna unguiculata]
MALRGGRRLCGHGCCVKVAARWKQRFVCLVRSTAVTAEMEQVQAWWSGVEMVAATAAGWWKERRKLGLGFWEMKVMTWQNLIG